MLLLDDEKHSEQLVVRVLCKVVGWCGVAQRCLALQSLMISWHAGANGRFLLLTLDAVLLHLGARRQ